ncbi:hypothetical protein [Bradyrhizobium sp. BWA-3-5]|nr:hypothetical protein [Bradyrhizobium sp. BWA-3-5]WOH63921.1 hypothetical protein RX331_25155 [Bradyrhizobium sp. BWA-3-5]
MPAITNDYAERFYAGALGRLISVYLAFLIGRAKSTHSYAFLRLFELQP